MTTPLTTEHRAFGQLADAVNRASRLVSVICAPEGLRAVRRWRPFSISAFRLVQAIHSTEPHFGTIIDVGANIGQFTAAALGTWPSARVIAIEPLPEAACLLRQRPERERLKVHQVAAGSLDGTVKFYPHRYSLSSSVLPTLPDLRDRPWGKEGIAIETPLRRLDTVLEKEALIGPVLLKLDVQGSEITVLDGAIRTLEHVAAIVLEMAFKPSYESQPLFPEVHRFLSEAGWRCMRPLDWRQERGQIVEGDFLYQRD